MSAYFCAAVRMSREGSELSTDDASSAASVTRDTVSALNARWYSATVSHPPGAVCARLVKTAERDMVERDRKPQDRGTAQAPHQWFAADRDDTQHVTE